VLALTALAIKLTSRGPIVFSQERTGLEGEPFRVLKLRTMYQDAERLTGPVWSTDDDPRITRVGKLLRKFRIDELPQLWNVLRGDMSLVGPRPERPVFVEQLAKAIPHYRERLLVRPGITGWAQVMAPYAASVGDSARKLQFDLYYTKNVSLWLDAVILLLTARTVLFGRERAQGGMSAGRQLAGAETVGAPAGVDPAVLDAMRLGNGGRGGDIARA
jgi:lipopolysaccharide/colanic/teichoic acid biosynthesis glycosyltransferase